MKKRTETDAPRVGVSLAAWDETVRLYSGWLAYLLRRLGEETVRVSAEDLRQALTSLSCRVEREGDGYVIRMGDAPVSPAAKGGESDGEA